MTKVASVVDLFCGAGGLTHGFYQEGFSISAGIDIDEECRYPYEENNNAPFLCKDIAELNGDEVKDLFPKYGVKILVGCAPCQPFSTYNQNNNNSDWKLLNDFSRLIELVRPDIISMENVPRLLTFKGGEVFNGFKRTLEKLNYYFDYGVLYGPDYGLAQTRSRLVVVASKFGEISLPKPTHTNNHLTVRDVIGNLPELKSGEVDSIDPLHRSSRLSDINLKRIRSSKPGGTWRDWDEDLVADCHKSESGKTYSAVYGRMAWDKPSPTITTQFYGFGNGRFGHPIQNRAISLREGAILQSFPKDYKFTPAGEKVFFSNVGRLIGNAVPVVLGQAIAKCIKKHLQEYGEYE